jgi:hypothetical protein
MQVLWQSKMNLRFGCKIEVCKISQKFNAETGQSRRKWPSNSKILRKYIIIDWQSEYSYFILDEIVDDVNCIVVDDIS